MTDSNSGERSASEQQRDAIAADYFQSLPFTPYPVQEEALLAYFTNPEGVLVCAPTGTGKTLIAEAAVYEALRSRTRMYYTTPLIALTDQKLDELRQSAERWGFSANDVGLVTGNRQVNPDAPVLVVVAEILLNRLLNREAFDFDDVSAVVMDEFHSFNDAQRGVVWELTLGLLPPHVRLLLLSATVGNSMEFTQWLGRAHGRRIQLVEGTERKVPLQFEYVEDQILADFAEQVSAGDEEQRRTPGLVFCFNRAQCWTVGEMLKGKKLIDKARQAELADYLNAAEMREGAGPKLKAMLMRGVGVHHAGVLPRYRRIVEELFQRKLLSLCVCTETLAAGINLPARSVILPSLLKGPKDKKKLVEAATAHQIFGRAGRPQYDDRGFVYALAHEDDVKLHKWKQQYDQIPEDTKDPGLLKMKKQLKKKMPKRRSGEAYWTPSQFEQLRDAASAKLKSRGRLPWRLLAYMLMKDPSVQPLRDLVGRRLLPPKEMEQAQRELNRMLITLWKAGYLQLDPKPRFAASKPAEKPAKKTEEPNAPPQAPPAEAGLFSQLMHDAGMQPSATPETEASSTEASDAGDNDDQDRAYELTDYKPEVATPTSRLPLLVQLRSIHPLYGVYMADQLAIADQNERLQALESVLEVPGTVARLVRVPKQEDLPAGPLATTRLDPLLLQLGLATAEELGATDDEDEEVQDRGFGRVMFEERVWPLTLPEKLQRLFQNDFPRIDDLRIRPVWIVGELLQYGGDFNKYITTHKLQKEEGILFRHLLRMILLLDEMANIPPNETTPEQWEDPLDDLADQLTETCRAVDAESTDEVLENAGGNDELIEPGRRKAK